MTEKKNGRLYAPNNTKKVKEAAKQKLWKELEMVNDGHTNCKFWNKALKSLGNNKKCSNKYTKSNERQILQKNKRIMARWKEYFEDFLNIN